MNPATYPPTQYIVEPLSISIDVCLCPSLQILALVAVRRAMDYIFSQHDLSYLDDVIPEKDKKKKEDEKRKKKQKKGSIDSEIDFVRYFEALLETEQFV